MHRHKTHANLVGEGVSVDGFAASSIAVDNVTCHHPRPDPSDIHPSHTRLLI